MKFQNAETLRSVVGHLTFVRASDLENQKKLSLEGTELADKHTSHYQKFNMFLFCQAQLNLQAQASTPLS